MNQKPQYDESFFCISSSVNRTRLAPGSKDMFLLGIDAEVVVTGGGGRVYPHQVLCPQDRTDQLPWFDASGGYDWHGDGFAFEVCVAPDNCIERLVARIGNALGALSGVVQSDGWSTPTLFSVPQNIAAEAPENVRALGCMPSFNVYGDPGRPHILHDNERTTGCHLHISHPDLDFSTIDSCIMWADVLVGGTWAFISQEDPRAERRRRMCYGRAGEHRKNFYQNIESAEYPNKADYWCAAGKDCEICKKNYEEAITKHKNRKDEWVGYEYRVLPGAALSHPIYFSLMLTLFRKATALGMHYGSPPADWVSCARQAINKADRNDAAALMKEIPWCDVDKKIIEWAGVAGSTPADVTEWRDAAGFSSGYLTYFYNRSSRPKSMVA